MAANKPPIAAWAPSTALAKLASRHNNSPCVLTDGPAEFNDVALIRLTDYEGLQAECEKLRKDAERYRWLRDNSGSHGLCVADIHYWSDEYIGQAYVELSDGESLDADIDEAIRDWERRND